MFAGFEPKPSPWGYNWTVEDVAEQQQRLPQGAAAPCRHPPPDPMAEQLAHMPAALLSTLKREKKPFTYTPGGVNLSEVLNARLQKRLERKKRYTEERQEDNGLPRFDPSRQVVVTPTYNTPLNMYSMDNALEVLEVQAELAAGNKSAAASRSATLPRNHTFRFEDSEPGRGVSQSKAFRVLQIMTDTEEDDTGSCRAQHRDEMRFTGVRDSAHIPSRFFHTLQKITGTDNEEQEEHRQVVEVARPVRQQEPSPFLHRQPVSFPGTTGCNLKRPAAFIPSNLGGFRPVQPQIANGSTGRRMHHHPGHAGTDF